MKARRGFLMPIALILLLAGQLAAADLWVGTWIRKSITGAPADKVEFTMTIETFGKNGYKLAYRLNGFPQVTTLESTADGTDGPVLIDGKPTGETMTITRVDDHHTTAVLKMNGKQFGTSSGTLSADANTLTVEDIYTGGAGMPPGHQTEVWIRK